jgi:hypothetical protein
MLSATAVGGFIEHYVAKNGSGVIWDVLGAQINVSPASVSILIVASLAAEIFVVANMRKPSRRLETVVVVTFSSLTAAFAMLFGRYFLLALMNEAFPGLMLLLALAVFSGIYVLFLVLIDAASENAKNIAISFFSIATGAFISASFGTWIILLVLVSVVGVDIAGNLAISPGYVFEPIRMSFTTDNWAIGLGDLLSYSIVAAHSYILGGPYLLAGTTFLILLASALTLRYMRRRSVIRVPGLPFTLAPSVALLGVFWLMTTAFHS